MIQGQGIGIEDALLLDIWGKKYQLDSNDIYISKLFLYNCSPFPSFCGIFAIHITSIYVINQTIYCYNYYFTIYDMILTFPEPNVIQLLSTFFLLLLTNIHIKHTFIYLYVYRSDNILCAYYFIQLPLKSNKRIRDKDMNINYHILPCIMHSSV